MSSKPLTSAQIRAARALIRWSAQELATKTAVGVTTIRRAELTASETKLTRVNDQAIRRVLEAAGVEFIDENGGGPGVRLSGRCNRRKARRLNSKAHPCRHRLSGYCVEYEEYHSVTGRRNLPAGSD